MKKILIGAALLLAGVTAGPTVMAQDEEDQASMARDLAVVQRPLYDMSLPSGEIAVTVRTERPANSYKVGDAVRFFVTSRENAYLTVVNVGATGKTTVLYPNASNPYTRIRAGQTLAIPRAGANWAVQAQGPAGVEVIKVFASSSPRAVFSGGKYQPAGVFRSFDGSSEDAVRDLGVVIAQAPPRTRWGSATLLFRVSAR